MRGTRESVLAFWKAMETNDFRAASLHLAPDFRLEWPQSGEAIEGRENFAALNAAYPAKGLWRFTVRRIVCEGDDADTDVAVTDGEVAATALTFHTVRDGLIARQVEYWPDPYDAPAWRAQWVARMGGG